MLQISTASWTRAQQLSVAFAAQATLICPRETPATEPADPAASSLGSRGRPRWYGEDDESVIYHRDAGPSRENGKCSSACFMYVERFPYKVLRVVAVSLAALSEGYVGSAVVIR